MTIVERPRQRNHWRIAPETWNRVSGGPFGALLDMNTFRIEGETLDLFARDRTKLNLGRSLRTFVSATLVGIFCSGAYLALTSL